MNKSFRYEIHYGDPGDFHLRFPQVERRSNRRPAIQNVADRYYDQPKRAVSVMAEGNGRMEGVVKFFNPDKGYGFIRRDGGQDVFVHANELRRSGIMDLTPITTGAKLAFAIEQVDGKGPKATDIVLLLEAPAEPPAQAAG